MQGTFLQSMDFTKSPNKDSFFFHIEQSEMWWSVAELRIQNIPVYRN